MTRSRETGDVGYKAYKKNYLSNGRFLYAQRGTDFTTTTPNYVYTVDRWSMGRGSSSIGLRSRQVVTTTYSYYMRAQRVEGNAETGTMFIAQRIATANCKQMANLSSKVTLTFRGRVGGTYSGGDVSVKFATTSVEDDAVVISNSNGVMSTGNADYAGQSFPVTVVESPTLYSVTFDLPAASLSGTYEISFSYAPTGTAGNADRLDIYEIQLESGEQFTGFEYVDEGADLAECQRYYEKSYSQGIDAGSANIEGQNRYVSPSTTLRQSFAFKTTKRAIPIVKIYSPQSGAEGFIYGNTGGDKACSVNLESTSGASLNSSSIVVDTEIVDWQWDADAEIGN